MHPKRSGTGEGEENFHCTLKLLFAFSVFFDFSTLNMFYFGIKNVSFLAAVKVGDPGQISLSSQRFDPPIKALNKMV